MSDPEQPHGPDRLSDLLDDRDRDELLASLDRLGDADSDRRKRALRTIRAAVEDRPGVVGELAPTFSPFLTDEDRAVRLTTAKLFVELAQSDPTVVLPTVELLSERLADDEECYYVRARCAEALGYVGVEAPEAVTDPETIADLRVGLSFDEPEVKEKLAKALAYVALGDPSRLRHQVDSLTEHLDDDGDLVRYYLCTALVTMGCAQPTTLADATASLRERLSDESPYVRGRAAEALGLAADSGVDVGTGLDLDGADGLHADGDPDDETPAFLTDRVRYLRRRLGDEQSVQTSTELGTTESVRDGTEDVVEAMTSPDERECPNCERSVPENGPPMCPHCGALR